MRHSMRRWALIVVLAVAGNLTFHKVTEPSSPVRTEYTGASQPSLHYAGSTLWNTFIDVVVQDTIAYCAMGAGLAVLNVSDPEFPVWLSKLYLPGQGGRDLRIRDSLIYIARGTGGLKIVDVSDPLQPEVIGVYPTQSGWDVELSGNLLYVSEFNYFTILDISDPTNPVFVAQSHFGRAYSTAAYGDYLYVAAGPEGVYVVDVSTPSTPTLVVRFSTFQGARHAEVSDGVLYVSSESRNYVGIWDLTDPALPSNFVNRTIPTFIDEFEIRDSILFGVGQEWIVIADMFHPPVFPATDVLWDSLISSIGMTLTDSLVLIADATTGLKVTSHSGAGTMPTSVGEFPAAMNIERVICAGDMAVFIDHVVYPYPQEEWRLRMVDMADPSAPVHVGSYLSPGYINDVELLGTYAYVAVNAMGLYILDIAEPSAPQAAAIIGGIHAVDMAIDSGLLYTTGANGLSVYDLSDPLAPSFMDSTGNVGTAYTLCIGGDYAYMMTDLSEFQVVNASDPANLVLAGSAAPGEMKIEQAAGNHVYLVNNDYFKIINVTNPAAPFVEGSMTTPARAQSAAVLGSYAYIADTWAASTEISAIRVVDVSSPASPVDLGAFPTPGYAFDVALASGHLLVADFREGLVLSLHFGRGDINEDGEVTNADLVYLINYLYKEGPPPVSGVDAGDLDCSDTIDMVDLIYLANYILRGGPPPC